jgi:hypothetical protein
MLSKTMFEPGGIGFTEKVAQFPLRFFHTLCKLSDTIFTKQETNE